MMVARPPLFEKENLGGQLAHAVPTITSFCPLYSDEMIWKHGQKLRKPNGTFSEAKYPKFCPCLFC